MRSFWVPVVLLVGSPFAGANDARADRESTPIARPDSAYSPRGSGANHPGDPGGDRAAARPRDPGPDRSAATGSSTPDPALKKRRGDRESDGPGKALPRRLPTELGQSGSPRLLPPPGDPAAGAPALGGGWAAGQVITPPAHVDAQAWPRGMLMRSADPQDDNVVAPGTDHLPGPRPLTQRLWRRFERGLDTLFELLVSASS
jgi:hypothetical protein